MYVNEDVYPCVSSSLRHGRWHAQPYQKKSALCKELICPRSLLLPPLVQAAVLNGLQGFKSRTCICNSFPIFFLCLRETSLPERRDVCPCVRVYACKHVAHKAHVRGMGHGVVTFQFRLVSNFQVCAIVVCDFRRICCLASAFDEGAWDMKGREGGGHQRCGRQHRAGVPSGGSEGLFSHAPIWTL